MSKIMTVSLNYVHLLITLTHKATAAANTTFLLQIFLTLDAGRLFENRYLMRVGIYSNF